MLLMFFKLKEKFRTNYLLCQKQGKAYVRGLFNLFNCPLKKYLFFLILFFLSTEQTSVYAQGADHRYDNYGIWQYFGTPISKTVLPELNGRLCNFFWKDIEPAPGIWDWTVFDSGLAARAMDSLPIIFMVYTKEDAPDWLYTNGVPKVDERDKAGNVIGHSPYYADADYKFFFKRMNTTVRQHVETLHDSIRTKIIGVQACFGSTGDYISYKGDVDPQYNLDWYQFFRLFKELSKYYYNE